MATYNPPVPPPIQHQPYSHPPPSVNSIPVPPPRQRHHSHSGHPPQPADPYYMYGSTPPSVGSTTPHFDPSLPPVPAGQVLPPQPHPLQQSQQVFNQYGQPLALPPPSGAHSVSGSMSLLPSAAMQQMPPDYYRRGSHESHRSHHSHHSHRSHHSSRARSGSRHGSRHHSPARDDPRPTFGDTLILMWDSVWNAFSRRRE